MPQFSKFPQTSPWIEETLGSMSTEQKIGQLLHPCMWPSASQQQREHILADIEVGGMFLFSGVCEQFISTTKWLATRSKVPIIISSDLENGAGVMVKDATVFPSLMALGAADSEELAYEMGKAAAVEGCACGIHWSFGPVVDINVNPHNPITSTRSLGDNVPRIRRLSRALIRGMQEHGLCATAKHFPGDGFDDRDQHLCNTINPLRMDQWFAASGALFADAIDCGVWSIMVGHISLPAWDCGDASHMQLSTPASVSRRITTDLLRAKMGFQGVAITDAMDMAGVTAWGKREDLIPAAVNAGCDMILFAEVRRDFDILKNALHTGLVNIQRIDEAVRRILALKETVGLHKIRSTLPNVSTEDSCHFQQCSVQVAQKAVTVVRDRNKVVPLVFQKGMRILSYHFHNDAAHHQIDGFDDLLRKQNAEVTHFDDGNSGIFTKQFNTFNEYDCLIINAVLCPSWGIGSIRPSGLYMRDIWPLATSHHPRLVVISWGSPYLGYEMPHIPCIINAYSPDPVMQKAVVAVLTGEAKACGTSPVDLESPYRYKSVYQLSCYE
ncbi:MAG: hypothetical protein JW795_11795 [Chitinivibrionales bacterium]|nr:hypothetical protein [Chitinivibrionales bacterium]